MQGLRSHAGLVAVTVGAFALLSVPVVAIAKGPPQDVGGDQNPAGKDAPEAHAHAPAPKPTAPKPAQPEPSGQAKGHPRAPAGADDGPAAGAPSPAGGAHAGGAPKEHKPRHAGTAPEHGRVAPGHAKRGPHSPAEGSSEPRSSSGEVVLSGGSPDAPSGRHPAPEPTGTLDLPSAGSLGEDGGVAGAVTGEAVELPEDASPATLPFTGLQLALLALIGVATSAAGLLVRRRV